MKSTGVVSLQIGQRRPAIYALIDCNNFYASCERVFNPGLINHPVIVLSNNDGCVIARSEEAKAIGIRMGIPAFEISDLIERNGVHVFSSNYALYGDLSARVMATLSTFSPEMEIYSIDEAFLDLTKSDINNLEEFGRHIKNTVLQWTGIPVSVGIGPTKTLAKLANHIAKSHSEHRGVFSLQEAATRSLWLRAVPAKEIWGIGEVYQDILTRYGIHTADDFLNAGTEWVKKTLTITGSRVQYELAGIRCIPLQSNPDPRKGICTSRSFGRALTSLEDMEEALSEFAAATARKLRRQKCGARAVMVFVMTGKYAAGTPYVNSITIQLPVATNLTNELTSYSLKGLRKIFRKGFLYKKTGLVVTDLIPEDQYQQSIWDDEKRERYRLLMKTIDRINSDIGQGSVRFAVQGSSRRWKMIQERLSARYTTRWNEILRINIGKGDK